MSLYDFVIPLGIATIAIVLCAVLTGLFKKILPAKVRLKIHKIFGLTALVIGLVHGAIVFYFNFLL